MATCVCFYLSRRNGHSVFIEASLNQKTKMSSIYNIILYAQILLQCTKPGYVYIEKGKELQKGFFEITALNNVIQSTEFCHINRFFS